MSDILLSMNTSEGLKRAYLENDFDRKLMQEPEVVVARMGKLFEVRDPNNVLGTLRETIHNGQMPILVVNHQSLSDGPALSVITSQLQTDFNLPVAASLDEGQQGSLIQSVNSRVDPVLAQRNLFTVPIVTGGDVEKRGMKEGPTGLAKLLKTAAIGRGFAMFPEASVEGGRTNGRGGINGLVKPPNPRTFTQWVERFAKQGADPVVVPVGINGGYNIFNPDSNSFPDSILRMLIGFEQTRTIGTITLGNLIAFSEVGTGVQTDDFFMTEIAKLLPESARGAYPLATIS